MTQRLIDRMAVETDFAVQRLYDHPSARRMLDGTADELAAARYYATAHPTVQQATSLLVSCHRALVEQHGPSELAALVLSKSQEESGHHLWLEDDLRALGYPLGGASTPSAGVAASAYLQGNRALIAVSGYAFLGTAWILESLAVRCGGLAADNLRKRGAIACLRSGSRTGVSFLSLHHDADVGHLAELSRIAALVVDPLAQDYMVLGARLTATLYADFF